MGQIVLETSDQNKIKYIIGKDEDGYYLLNKDAEYVDHMSLERIVQFIKLEELGELI